MVAIVAGNGLGLFNTSLNSLGGSGSPGQGNLGQAGGQALVNISNGNLVLRFTDEQLSGLGQDLLHTRTYNTRGDFSDGDADGWKTPPTAVFVAVTGESRLGSTALAGASVG